VIHRLLIANRGEIAVRVARGARELGISPVGVYSDADEHALFRSVMDESVRIGPASAVESYLAADRILAAARTLGADAVHPGYGFLSERAHFAQAVVDAGLIFVGPTPSAIAAMGSKIDAKRRVREFGVPVIPGYEGDDQSPDRLRREAEAMGMPVLIKASAGGGGRGMRIVHDIAAFDEALNAAKRESLAAFGDDSVLLERYLRRPRHIEFQILADSWGTTLYLGERECSIQRRHQKVLEEAPSVALDPALRATMGEAAVAAARSVAYENAGTVEFMLDEDGQFYFLEMNARLQVEHPVTELVYGIDLVQQQLRIARGEQLRFAQSDLVPRGWAIEARLNAEDPARGYLPSTGTIGRFEVPAAPGVRVDSGVHDGSEISIYYDSMIAKIIVWGTDRAAAIARLESTLRDTRVTGVKTNLPLLRAIVADDAYRSGDTSTRFLDDRDAFLTLDGAGDVPLDVKFLAAGALVASDRAWRMAGVGVPIDLVVDGTALRASVERRGREWLSEGELGPRFSVETRGNDVVVVTGNRTIVGDVRLDADGGRIVHNGRTYLFVFGAPPDADPRHHTAAASAPGTVASPMPGRIVSVDVAPGDVVEARELLVVLEAMKMEHRIEAPAAGTVESVHVKPGDLVGGDAALVTIGTPASFGSPARETIA
jgi:3-methylcrotonyl-CoA carboxylase alpha subunit